jgi:hypothetical protein
MTLRSEIELTVYLIFRLRPCVRFSLFDTIYRLMPGTYCPTHAGILSPMTHHWQSSSCHSLMLTHNLVLPLVLLSTLAARS